MGMRAVAWCVGVGVVLAACGGSAPELLESVPTPSPTVDIVVSPVASTSVPATTPTTSPASTPATTPAGDATATTQTTEQGDGSPNRRPMLAIGPALLPDDAFPPPWEPKGRRADQLAYGAGPNQTDCAPYWRIEEIRGGGGGHAFWWIDGANANHYVSRLDKVAEDALLGDLAGLATTCPVVSWGEGGSFTIESIAVDDGIGFRFTVAESNETTWIGVTTHGGLVSVLDVPTWLPLTPGSRPVDFDGDDLNRLVSQMYGLLLKSPELSGVPATTAPTVKTVPSTNVPQITPTTTVPPQTTTSTTELPADSLAHLLLQAGDLPAGFGDVDIDEHGQDSADDDLVEICPAAISIERINRFLEWDSNARTSGDVEFGQLIGRASSFSEAGEIVTQFAQVADCDLSSSFGAESVVSGGSIAVAGADAAANLFIESLEGEFTAELVVFAVGDVIVVITLSGSGPDFDSSLADVLAVRAAKKIAAASR